MAYKLSYFDFRGKGEIIRLVFAQAGVSYEDVRIQRSNWLPIKPGTRRTRYPAFHYYSRVFPVRSVVRCSSDPLVRNSAALAYD